MIVYIVTASLSCLLIWLEEKISSKNKIEKILFLVLAILIPTLVAAFRSDIIGTDVRTYVEPIQNWANSNNTYSNFINYNGTLINGELFNRFEKGYVSLIYFCSKINPSLSFNLFVSELIMIGCVLYGLIRFNKIRQISIVLGLFIFYNIFYNMSFNMVRQSIAMFILLFGFNYLLKEEWLKYFVVVVLACLFHNSAIIGLLFFVIYYFLYCKKQDKYNFSIRNEVITNEMIRTIIVVVIGLILLSILPILRNLINAIGFPQYAVYIPSHINFSLRQILVRLPFLLILLAEWPDNKDNKLRYFYLIMFLTDIFVSLFSSNETTATGYSSRIAWYAAVFYIYALPDMLNFKNKSKDIILTILLVIYLIIYWYVFTVVLNYNATVPYVFRGF